MLNWLYGNLDKKTTFSLLGDINMCSKYLEQHLGQAVNVIKPPDVCLPTFMFVYLFMTVGDTSRRYQTSAVNQTHNIFQSSKLFLLTLLCSR